MNPQAKPESLRQAMAWAHTWAGLLLGCVMFAIFLTGTLSFFRHEITLWMKPELQGLGPADAGTLARVEARLREMAPNAASWSIGLPDARQPGVRVFWREPAQDGKPGRFHSRLLDPATGAVVVPRKSFGGDFFYRFHFELRSAEKSRWILEGRWAVGVATMAMFVALLSGIVTHRRIFLDFFTFRPAKGGQRAWLDAHNLSGVLVLPFYLMITFSGLMMFHTLYLPAGIAAAYGAERNDYFRESQGAWPAPKGPAPATPMPPLPLADALAQAQARWPGSRIEGLSVQRHGGGVLRIELRRDDGLRLQYPGGTLVFDGTDPRAATMLHLADNIRPAARTYGVLYGLHMARFADWGLRWVLFGFGLLGSAMIATGLLLWSVKREAQRARSATGPAFGPRLVDSLNIASIAGLPLAIGAYLMANRLLPTDWPERQDSELHACFAAWGLSLLWALLRPSRRTWRLQLALAALLFAALPLASAGTGQVHLLQRIQQALASQGWTLAALELAWLCTAVLLGLVAWRLPAARARSSAATDRRVDPAPRVPA